MKKRINISIFCCWIFSSLSYAQHPVKFEIVKVATATVLPTLTATEAYNKNNHDGKLDPSPMFGGADNRFNQIFTGTAARTQKQQKAADKSEKILTKAHDAGMGEMSPEQMAAYLKANPALQKQTGVDPSAMELAAKMQDPAFLKKLESMSDMEKAAFLSPYASRSASAAAKKSDPSNAKVVVEAGKLVHKFNEEYRVKNLEAVELAIHEMNEKTDNVLEGELEILQKEWDALPPIGANSPAWASEKRTIIEEKRKAAKNSAWSKKLKGYRDIISASISLFKIAAAPFDQFMAKCNYGEKYAGSAQTDLLAQLAGYQDGYFRILHHLQDLSKDVTMRAAAFYEQELKR